MLHAAFVRSPYAHARVDARSTWPRLPDGLRRADAPPTSTDLGVYGCQVKDQRVLADVARFAGDIVAAVAAPTREAARAAGGAVEVEWEELPAVFDPVEAVAEGAPLLHEHAGGVGAARRSRSTCARSPAPTSATAS